MKLRTYRPRFLLILTGVGLGYLARLVLGVPNVETEQPNRFIRPLPADTATDQFDSREFELPIRAVGRKNE